MDYDIIVNCAWSHIRQRFLIINNCVKLDNQMGIEGRETHSNAEGS